MAKRPTGPCRICGEITQLSFEHVPPRAAFNDRRVLYAHGKQLLRAPANLDSLSGKVLQKGAGRYTLCERCNNQTGSWYGPKYADWADQGMQIVRATKGTPTLIYNFHIFPLRVIKQVIGAAGLLRGMGTGSAKTFIVSEVTFPPFGFLMTVDSPTPDERLCDISGFSKFAYKDERTLSMKLPVMPIYSIFPGDYRSREQVHREAKAQAQAQCTP